ncbi:hypothetical protein SAMN04487857_10111 [Pseudomonas sp. ok272]|uniref:hypothetical protein n=1 Tax=unclassified Pseudomonas TaxID=196821 RepID=UPI0008BC13F1|nr:MULTISPECIES: hypothetical protein [unclassified Pseudomonas]SEM29779.1 hypothetical protein SAMN04487857_10111 [Pseudomonas sp. ok272]SFM29996.1 hypothetical protein SAMN04487858_10211 [Pseudomonas sp. ok602]
MRIFQRIVLLIKVLVMLSIGISSAWASTGNGVAHDQGFWGAKSVQGSGLMVAKSESDSNGQGGDSQDDPATDGSGDDGDQGSTDDEGGDSDS